MLRVGLTGGIGAGKSSASAALGRRGAVVIDADVLAREALARGSEGLVEVVGLYGPSVLTASGDLDRPALAARIFGDEAARRALEAVVHPRVRSRAAELEAAAVAADPHVVVVHDVPLLVETGQAPSYDVVVVVDVDPELQVSRLVARGLTEAAARARMAAQATRERRLAAATVVLDGSGSLDDLDRQVDALWEELRTRACG